MKILANLFKKHLFSLQAVSYMALLFATAAANSRCAYIFHDPKKPVELQQLKKF